MNILAVCALLLTPATLAPAPPVPQAASPAAVVVKIGSASLEEYAQGGPASRVQLLRRN